jgi:hypothetical protein
VDNDWFDRNAGASVYCVTSDRYRNVLTDPAPDQATTVRTRGGTPDRLLVPTFSDALKDATDGKAKVVAISFKDRSAVLPGGHKPDACYWVDNRTGTFCSSNYYRDRPHAWVNGFNRARRAERWFDQTWDRLRPDIDYAHYSGPDDVASEGQGVSRRQGRVFPHPMNAGLMRPAQAYYDTVETSPYGNELVLEFALRAMDAEKLGAQDVPDFLSISFSSNDLIGHQFGPDSQEVLDVTLRSDLIVRDLLKALDQRFGKGQYVVALSADHGICPMPEVSAAKGMDAKRVMLGQLTNGAVAFLRQTFKDTNAAKAEPAKAEANSVWIQSTAFPWYYLNYKTLAARGLQSTDVADVLAAHLRKQPSVLAVYTRKQIESGVNASDEIGQRVRKAYHPERCGDVAIVMKPYYLPTTSATGTTHGSPHAYDTHVPLMIAGPGVPVGSTDEAITPQAVVPILSQLLGIAPPSGCDTGAPERLKK